MGQLKTEQERYQIALDIFNAWNSLHSTNCLTFANVPGKGLKYNNCVRNKLEEIERYAVQKYGDFPELESIMLNLFVDKKIYKDIGYHYGVTLDIYNDLATKYKELRDLDLCFDSGFSDKEAYLCAWRRIKDLEEYGRETYPYNERDVRYFIENYLLGKRQPGVVHYFDHYGYKYGVAKSTLNGDNVIGGRRKQRYLKQSRRLKRKIYKKRSLRARWGPPP